MKIASLSGLLLALFALPTLAQTDYPNRAARVVVGFAAGGPTDNVARLVARHLNEDLKQPFIVDNKAGAAGNIATAEVVKAAPDGYTSLIASVNITINPAVMDDIRFDGRTDLKAVKSVATAPTALTPPATPARTTAPSSDCIGEPWAIIANRVIGSSALHRLKLTRTGLRPTRFGTVLSPSVIEQSDR